MIVVVVVVVHGCFDCCCKLGFRTVTVVMNAVAVIVVGTEVALIVVVNEVLELL